MLKITLSRRSNTWAFDDSKGADDYYTAYIMLDDFKRLAKETRDVHELARLVVEFCNEEEEKRAYDDEIDQIISKYSE